MLFNSWQFIFVFLPVTAGVFALLPVRFRRLRKLWLCAASFVFYGYWSREIVPLLVLSILLNYSIAELLVRRTEPRFRRAILTLGVAGNLSVLAYFKYMNFFVGTAGWLLSTPVAPLTIILPLAISFYTLTQIGYIMDVKRDASLHHGFLDYTLFVVFFPHLIAGPIVRHWEIIPQYTGRDLKPDRDDVGVGIALFLMGLYKKVLFADAMAVHANAVYGAAAAGTQIGGVDAWLGTVAFALQIYFDFSGYSDMAIGLARMFGIRFPCNFDSPYRAGNVIEFWRRWHMTLSRFLREYVYHPLGGNRCAAWRHGLNVLLTLLLSGLWHGAGWMFIIWGALHGVYLIVAHQWRRLRERLGWTWNHWSYQGLCVLTTSGAVLVAWVFFRAPNLSVAREILTGILGGSGFDVASQSLQSWHWLIPLLREIGIPIVPGAGAIKELVPTCTSIVLLLLWVWFVPNTQQCLGSYKPVLETEMRPTRWRPLSINGWTGFVLGALFFLVIHGSIKAVPSPFIYFKF